MTPGGGASASARADVSPGSSGVLITKNGYVLSDGDAGAIFVPGKDRTSPPARSYAAEVEIRIPDLKRGTYASSEREIVKRVEAIDSTLLKITKPPAAGLPFVCPAPRTSLEIGQFTFAMGTAFGQGEGGTAALTAGIVAALVPAPAGQAGGRFQEIETSAAINPGVNGGPLVDVDGNLVGIISTWGEAKPANPFQFLGKAFPIDRIRDAYPRACPTSRRSSPIRRPCPPRRRRRRCSSAPSRCAARRAAPARREPRD